MRDASKCYRNAMELDETSVAALIGVIRCQLFSEDFASPKQKSDALDEVSQQLEFLREVQQTIKQDPVRSQLDHYQLFEKLLNLTN